ncbi:MAG: ATP-dependent Clp protease ATP-binding subunit [Alphaproteobacteria bacterium]|nr:MAG: ATP-dependent Clp protease ATP-binding subunit [Alphaproteobacteria bacterium]
MTGQGWRVPDKILNAFIQNWCRDLTTEAQNAVDLPEHLKEDALAAVRGLARLTRNSVCITGEAGTGKTSVIGAVAQYLANGADLPESLQGARVIMLDLDRMTAGAQFRGQFEERLYPLLEGLRERDGCLEGRKIIFACDNLPSLLGPGKSQGNATATDMIKSFIVGKGISVLAAASPQEYQACVAKDAALARRFEEIMLQSSGQRVREKADTLAEIFIKGAAQPVRIMPVIVYRQKPARNSFIA